MSTVALINNGPLQILLANALADQGIDYKELLALLQTAAQAGLTETEWQDLNAIYVQYRDQFGDTSNRDYLQTIFANLVLGNPANAKWWGNGKAEPLGNLQAGSSQQQVERLIDKWFLGNDVPLTQINKLVAKAKPYQMAAGPLFDGDVSANDIVQGKAETCYLLATLGSIANSKENNHYLVSSFINNGNDTYGVRLFYNGEHFYTTVNQALPVNDKGKLVFASDDVKKTLDGELWVSLLEKAYAQFNAQIDTQALSIQEIRLLRLIDTIDHNAASPQWNQENSYSAIGRSLGQAIQQFTNLPYSYYTAYANDTGFNDETSADVHITDMARMKATLKDALDRGEVAWLWSRGDKYGGGDTDRDPSNGKIKFTFVPKHCYMILDYDDKTDTFTFRNPWGGGLQQDVYIPEFKASIERFWNNAFVRPVIALSNANTQLPSFEYTLNIQNTGGMTNEGGKINVVISRNATGAASTVYLSAQSDTHDSASASDYVGFTKQPVHFDKNQTTRIVTVDTYADTENETREAFSLKLYALYHETNPITQTAYIENVSAQQDNYTLTSQPTATEEGGEMWFTVTRNTIGQSATVYLSTIAQGTGQSAENSSDYQGFDKAALKFESFETQKIVKIATLNDTRVESPENITLALFNNVGQSTPVITATQTIEDDFLLPYHYRLFSDADTLESAVIEGNKATFTVVRSGIGSASTVYVSTRPGSADADDYVGLDKTAVTFAPNQQFATVTVPVNPDWFLEDDEYFTLDLFDTPNDPIYTAYGIAYIRGFRPDTDIITNAQGDIESMQTTGQPTDTYTLVRGGSDNVEEGSTVTYTITRANTGLPATVYLSTLDNGASSGDYQQLDKLAVDFAPGQSSKELTLDIYEDDSQEKAEAFSVNLFQSYTDKVPAVSDNITIQNVVSVFDYTLNVASSVAEGGTLAITVNRSGRLDKSSTAYLHVSGLVDEADLNVPDFLPVVFPAQESKVVLSIPTYQDALIEGPEPFNVLLFNNYADAQAYKVAKHESVSLLDVPQSLDYRYTLTAPDTIKEGQMLTFTLQRNLSEGESTVFFRVEGTVNAADYQASNDYSVRFAPGQTVQTLGLEMRNDAIQESDEYLTLTLYKSYQEFLDYVSHAQRTVRVEDRPAPSYRYSVQGPATVDEGKPATFTVTRDGSGTESLLIVKVVPDSADGNDVDLSSKGVLFGETEISKKFEIATLDDRLLEGTERFTVNFADNAANFTTSQSVDIRDDETLSYTITNNGPVEEGGPVRFTVTRSATGKASSLYITPISGTDMSPKTVAFSASDLIRTIDIPTIEDDVPENTDYLTLKFIDNEANFDKIETVEILDDDAVGYTITSNSPVQEGAPANFEVWRSKTGVASNLTITPVPGSADARDFDPSPITLNFSATDDYKRFSIGTTQDNLIEGTEYFAADFTDSLGNVIPRQTVQILDDDTFSYTVSNNSPVQEGMPATFTVTRSGTGSASTLTVFPIAGTADANDFDIKPRTVEFGPLDVVKTFDIATIEDSSVENMEDFRVDFSDSNAGFQMSQWINIIDDDYYGYNYTLITNSPVFEGERVIATITRDGSDTAETVTVRSLVGISGPDIGTVQMANRNDFEQISYDVYFAVNENSKIVYFNTLADDLAENPEEFLLELTTTPTSQSYVPVIIYDGVWQF